METKQINIVWCDDNIDTLYNEGMKEKFQNHNCHLLAMAKCSDELIGKMADNKGFVDAIIVDFNLGKDTTTPSKEKADGFRWIHDNVNNDEFKGIPFYLYSGRELEFIEKKYRDYDIPMEGDYFFSENKNVSSKRKRYFQPGEMDDLLNMIEEEVAARCTPAFKVRQDYHEGFDAIEKFKLKPSAIMNALLLSDDATRDKIVNNANPLRMVIESMVSKMVVDEIIPMSFVNNLNGVPYLLSGNDSKNKIYCSREDFMPMSLSRAFSLFLEYTQDGSHDKEDCLNIEFANYLRKSKDIYIVKSLAIICLDIIKWSFSFYNKYKNIKPCKFEPFVGKVDELIEIPKEDRKMQYAVVMDTKGRKYLVQQYPEGDRRKYKKGSSIRVTSAKPTRFQDFDFYSWGENLDVY